MPQYWRREGDHIIWDLPDVATVITAGEVSSPANKGYAQALDVQTNNELNSDWMGTSGTVTEIRQIIAQGWPKAVSLIAEHLREFEDIPIPRSVRRRRIWTDQGDTLEQQRVWSGALDRAWQRCVKREVSAARFINVCCNVSCHARVAAHELTWRGATAIKLADLLTEAGYNVALTAIRYARADSGEGDFLLQRVCVKAATAPLDILAVSGTVAFPGFFRWALFRLAATGPVGCTKGGRAGAMQLRPQTYVPGLDEVAGLEAVHSAESARRWIQQTITNLNT